MPLGRWPLCIGTAALLWAGSASAGGATASHADHVSLPNVFLPVEARFARSSIPVYYPTWLPRIPQKAYPGFTTTGRSGEVGPGYVLGLYSSPDEQAPPDRLFSIVGAEGDVHAVNGLTRPVWLGSAGWAYIDFGPNVGYTISFVRPIARSVKLFSPPREYTYTVLIGCAWVGNSVKRIEGCLEHIVSSVRRYTPVKH